MQATYRFFHARNFTNVETNDPVSRNVSSIPGDGSTWYTSITTAGSGGSAISRAFLGNEATLILDRAYRVIDDDRFVGSRRIFLSGVVSWVWWNLLIRKISFLNELYARMFLLCLFSRIGVDYFNIEEFYFLMEDLQIKSLFYSLVYRFGFSIEERKYERSLDHRLFLGSILAHFGRWIRLMGGILYIVLF